VTNWIVSQRRPSGTKLVKKFKKKEFLACSWAPSLSKIATQLTEELIKPIAFAKLDRRRAYIIGTL
jgi:hypothetical protein